MGNMEAEAFSTPVELTGSDRNGGVSSSIEPEWPVAGPDERIKVLLIYPNYRGMNMLPPAIGLLSACLLQSGPPRDILSMVPGIVIRLER